MNICQEEVLNEERINEMSGNIPGGDFARTFNKLINEIESLKLNKELTYVHMSLNKENKKKQKT